MLEYFLTRFRVEFMEQPMSINASNHAHLVFTWVAILSTLGWLPGCAQASTLTTPEILASKEVACITPLPDFSYAGYGLGLLPPPRVHGHAIRVTDYGAIANDQKDDSKALLDAIEAARQVEGPVIVQLPPGRLIVSEILKIERSHFVLRGSGNGEGGSQLYFPRPLRLVDETGSLDELRQYLHNNDKRQIDKNLNIDLPFSEYSWSGGFLWVQVPNSRATAYLEGSDVAPVQSRLTHAVSGQFGKFDVIVRSAETLKAGDVIQIRWFNQDGKHAPVLKELYGNTDLEIGSHHWNFKQRPLVTQRTTVAAVDSNRLTLSEPLMHDISTALPADVAAWQHLSEVGIEDLSLVFPSEPGFGHHLEQGYNGIYLTGVFNGWVRDVTIHNADSGILTYNSANLTLADISTTGERLAHYSVHIGSAHDVLVSDLKVFNRVIHPLSVNTHATHAVFLRAEVFQQPALDQHAGANHQNLFDNVTLHVNAKRDSEGAWYPIWDGSGASYWQPGHGRYNTTWNLRVLVESGAQATETVRLRGAAEGPDARIVGVHGNRNFEVDYRPFPYMEAINQPLQSVPSLYEYQLQRRRQQDALPAFSCE